MQLSTYLYSIAVLVALVYLMPHIRRQSPVECLALAWLYMSDTLLNIFSTVVFGLDWYFASGASENPENIPAMVKEGMETLHKEAAQHGSAVAQETAFSMAMIASLTLVRVYFGFVVMEAPVYVDQTSDGPFGEGLPDGEGRRGRLGR